MLRRSTALSTAVPPDDTIACMRQDGRAALAPPWLGWLMAAIALTAGLAACDGGDNTAARPDTSGAESPTPESSVSSPVDSPLAAPLFGKAILIETRVLNARRHRTVVVARSVIGEAAFCPGGRASGGSEGAAITTTFHCPGGTLTVRYSPIQRSLVQGAGWEVVSGTGSLADLRGGGSMVAVFDEDDPDRGREVFTGTVGK